MAARIPLWVITTTVFSSISVPIIKNVTFNTNTSNQIHNYFFRLPLFSKDNKDNKALINEDKKRIEGYYKKYYPHTAFVNEVTNFSSKQIEGENNPNFYIQVQKGEYDKNRELEWLKAVRLNQITIDKYYEKKALDSSLKDDDTFKELIKVENLFPERSKSAQNALNQEAIDLFLKNVKIPIEDIKRLVYYPSERTGAKRWFVWLDKDLLKLKLNLGFHIWFFNQPFLKGNVSVKNFFNLSKEESEKIKEKIESLYKLLTEEEKNFFSLYYSHFWIMKKKDNKELKAQEITSEEINKMYHLLSEKEEKIDIFRDHLLQVIEGGDKLAFESFFPNYITYASGPDALHTLEVANEFNSNVKVTITPDRRINKAWKVNEILDLFKNYSIKNFTLRTTDNQKDQWPISIFSKIGGNNFPIIREEYFTQKKVI
ncbi:hypothetical protein [Mycoplasma parvum]|uniref:Uncharacterized protein n=1 Tax=Mycoplasma parvum str. Indiana TaxID=1403316 RepID=U5NBG2_9MOLU|nr:hypothetical protein [Mycoplasma parvum]AGX88881.1 hypothetical protein PRV_00560 [Mycoplasma parvum str. Indiana]